MPASPSANLHSVAIHLLRAVRVEDDKSGLSPSRLSALSVVVFGGPLRLGDLARAEQVQASTMSVLVRSLEEEGWVRRDPDPADGRSVLVSATPAGTEILEAARARRLRRLDALLEPLSEAERTTVDRAVDILQHALATSVERSGSV
jgi:DNA-binding MarR family transcriptional regulator